MKPLLWLVLTSIALLIICESAHGVVHKIPTQRHKLAPEMAEHRIHKRYAKYRELLKLDRLTPDMVPNESSNKIIRTLKLAHLSTHVQVANISVGTPPQWFTVEVDWHYYPNMELLNINAVNWHTMQLANINSSLHFFHSGRSSSFSRVVGRYDSFDPPVRDSKDPSGLANGYRGKDAVCANGKDFKLTFGVLDEGYFGYFDKFSVDGILGLAPGRQLYDDKPTMLNFTNTITQMTSQLDNAVVTVWSDSSSVGDDSGQITFGSLDPDHCESNWAFIPQTKPNDYYSAYTVHLATMEATSTNGSKHSFKVNMDLAVVPDHPGIAVPVDWYNLILNISHAAWNKEANMYEVDCDSTKSGNITLRVGGHGFGRNSKVRNLTVTGAHYTAYNEYYDICYLDVYSIATAKGNSTRPVILGHNFAKEHCFAYNLKTNKIGFADSKKRLNTNFISANK